MAEKKSKIKTSRESWVKDTEDSSFSAGDRIRLFCKISCQANDCINNSEATVAEIRTEFATLCSSPVTNARVHESKIGQYLRLHCLSEDEVEKLAKDADCSDPIESGKAGQAKRTYKSRMTISHALLLAAVEDPKERKKLLKEAIANHWPHTVLKDRSREVRDGSIVHLAKSTGKKRVRNRATINALTTAVAELLKLLDELEDVAFAQAITKSARRHPADTLEKLKNLDSTFEAIRKRLPKAKKSAKVAAAELNKVVVKK